MNFDFSNEQIFNLDIPDFDDLKLMKISEKYLQIIILNNIIFSVFLLGLFFGGYYLFSQDFSLRQFIFGGIFILIIIIFSFLQSVIGFKFRKYAVREQDIVYQHGWLKRSLIIIPFNRIQHVKIEQGWYSKILHLKSLSVFTAGTGGGDLSLKGLPEDTAEGINMVIRQYISTDKKEDGEEN